MRVELASAADLQAVRGAYAEGRARQRDQGSTVWPEFSDDAILGEIAAQQLFRIVDGAALAGVFSVAYEDGAIWGERERGAHIYLHRIVRASGYRGQGLVDVVLDWARARCRALGRAGLRMDTWADNTSLIAYYQRLGFELIESRCIGEDGRLPPHYHGREFALLERSLGIESDSSPDRRRARPRADGSGLPVACGEGITR